MHYAFFGRPETFLLEHVLREPKAQRALMLWLSAARSAYMLKLKWARKPKIWMLTGQYLLDDARTVSISSCEETGKVGVTSAAVGALAGVPVGGSIGLGHNSKAQVTMEMPGQNVWAARYHLVDTDFVRLKAGEEAQLPPVIALHPDVTSRAGKAASWYMDTGGQEPEVATVQLEKQSEPKTRVQEVVEVIELPVGEGKAASEPEARVQEMVEVIELPDGEGKTTSENDGRGDYSRDLEEAIQEFEKVMGQGAEEDPDQKTDMVDTTAGGQLY
ncbi:uncharacterized protein HMPREF1541_10513 [Cyphellophora europaea CBS 101466]|uniref:Uncharacterized protein n=1 Tax=Cyphellophora europaea (strain CBS 101466) TaxID=1220924 RepID=W2S8F7_CYPE1|nr:uncharacterized protein HMPREF1541_10513 [Cyphellophora europaea CBS 101466]ETN44333.1 hypothetical protein HMPREF1541_10513 [Cyphellophora europaea CBS 101466]